VPQIKRKTASVTAKGSKKRGAAARHQLEPLEVRSMLAAAYPSDFEQYVVELINRARANPAAEAQRWGIDLNEGLAAGRISAAAKQPLAVNPHLTAASRGHSQWMIDSDKFGHTGAGGSSPGDRMRAAGYAFEAPWTWSENLALRSIKSTRPHADVFDAMQKDLFVDLAIPGRGHRVEMLNATSREVGAGVAYGPFSYYRATAVTQNYASSGDRAYLTGVVYTDAVAKDQFYTPGEGVGSVTVTAVRTGDGATFTTSTWSAGGYSLELDPGTYRVTASGGTLKGTVVHNNVVVGRENVKRDFVSATTGTTQPPTPTPPLPTPPTPVPPTPTPPTPPKPTPAPPTGGVPAAPSGLVATGKSSTSIQLKWTDNGKNETAYKVERSTDGRHFYPVLGGGANATSAVDTKLTAGKKYHYRVYAVSAAGKSPYSNVVVASPGGGGGTTTPTPPRPVPPATGAPAAPSGLAVKVSPTVGRAIELTWKDNGTNETGFQIERSTDGKRFYRLAATTGTFHRNTDLTPGKRYYYRVYAVNGAGGSTYSAVVSVVAK
jgi:uncharacterized protein YkwD